LTTPTTPAHNTATHDATPYSPVSIIKPQSKRVTIGGPKGGKVVTMFQALAALLAGWALVCLLFLVWWRPLLFVTGGFTGVSVLVGFLYSFLYFRNTLQKRQVQQLVSDDDDTGDIEGGGCVAQQLLAARDGAREVQPLATGAV